MENVQKIRSVISSKLLDVGVNPLSTENLEGFDLITEDSWQSLQKINFEFFFSFLFYSYTYKKCLTQSLYLIFRKKDNKGNNLKKVFLKHFKLINELIKMKEMPALTTLYYIINFSTFLSLSRCTHEKICINFV